MIRELNAASNPEGLTPLYMTIGESNEILSHAKSCMERGKIKEAIEILDSADTEGGRARPLRRKAEEVDEARLELREYSSLVDLEPFRMKALMRLETMSLADRQVQVKEWSENLLAELNEMKQNMPGPLDGDIDALAERVRTYMGDHW